MGNFNINLNKGKLVEGKEKVIRIKLAKKSDYSYELLW